MFKRKVFSVNLLKKKLKTNACVDIFLGLRTLKNFLTKNYLQFKRKAQKQQFLVFLTTLLIEIDDKSFSNFFDFVTKVLII